MYDPNSLYCKFYSYEVDGISKILKGLSETRWVLVQMDLQRKFIHVCELCDIECPGLDCFLAHIGGKKHCRLEGESRL